MTLNFIIGQIIGTIGLVVLMLSFQNNKKDTLLKFQTVSSLLYALQYLFLDAYTGFFMHLMCMIRNIIFNKYEDRKIPIYWLLIVVGSMIMLSLFSYKGLISLLPMIGVVIYSFAIWKGDNLKNVRIAEIIACVLYVIYNIKVLAISGLIATIIEIVAALIAIYRFDIKNKVIKV